MKKTTLFLLLILPALSLAQTTRPIQLRPIAADVASNTIEFRGISAGSFSPKIWQSGTLHLVPDSRSPMLEPLPGKFRNIYAPSAVQTPDGWRLFYGAWDGLESGNDHLYSLTTSDFLTFADRQILVEPGTFQHICNVSAVSTSVGSYAMLGTAYPDPNGLNKPAFFASPDGRNWNDHAPPYTLQPKDVVSMAGYKEYPNADINGMNVLLFEENRYRMYFADFKHFGKIYRATSRDGHNYVLDSEVMTDNYAPNDVKKFRVGNEDWYLMGLHMNGQQLWYTLSTDPLKFPAPKILFDHKDKSDNYMVAVGFVVQGGQEFPSRRLVGVLYGAGAAPSLDANRIFARWLQKRLVFVTPEKNIEITQSLGPNRQVLTVTPGSKLTGHFDLYSDDGQTLIGSTETVNIDAGHAYVISIQ